MGHFKVEHISGKEQWVDILIKAFPRIKFVEMRVTGCSRNEVIHLRSYFPSTEK